MADERFAAHTRSASFALTLSQAMIDRLLSLRLDVYLHGKYPWYRPLDVNFGEPASAVAEWTDPTMRALLRRGLLNVEIPDELPFMRHEAFPLTRAGELLCDLLAEADFELEAMHHRKVPPHPDDRHVMSFDAEGVASVEWSGRDRRDWANDARWLSEPRMDRVPS